MTDNTLAGELPLSPAATGPGMRTTSGWLLVLTLLVFLLVLWGALVRLTGSGISIPDWPFINGNLLPPMSETGWQAALDDYTYEAARLGDPQYPVDVTVGRFRAMFWIEYLHRTLAALAGILFLVVAVKAFRDRDVRQRVEVNFYVLAALLLAQGMMGGAVVLAALPGLLIAVHLLVAYIFFAGLVWTGLKLSRLRSALGGSRSTGLGAVVISWLVLLMFGVQLFIGGLVAGGGHDRVVAEWPRMFGYLAPPGELLWSAVYANPLENLVDNQVLLQFLHRWLPLLVFGVFIILWVKTAGSSLTTRARTALRAAGGLFGLQILVGILNVIAWTPLLVSLLHSALALGLFWALVTVVHEMRYGFVETTA